MTQKEKELLLRDLSARLPYNVIIHCTDDDTNYKCFLTTDILNELLHNIEYYNYKPYLRPMSTLTTEEKEEMHKLLSPHGTAQYESDGVHTPMNHYGEFYPYEFMGRILSYLDKKMLDYRGLISKGLALEAKEGMYKDYEKTF